MYDIITLGSATVDVFLKTKKKPEISKHHDHFDIAYHLGEKVLIEEMYYSCGGSGTNTAAAFSLLRLKTGFIGAVGNDPNGYYILTDLKRDKIDFLGKVKHGSSGFSVILPGADDRTILHYKGVNNSLELRDINLEKIKTRWLYVSTMLGKSFDTSLKLIEKLKREGVNIALNMSLYLANQGIHALSSLLKYTDIIILNKEEAIALTKKHQIEQIFHEFSKHTNALVVVTNSHKDVHAFFNNKIYIKKIDKIKPADTTGAGDAFASGFVYGIIKGRSILDSLEAGHKEALSILKHVGAKNNLLRKL